MTEKQKQELFAMLFYAKQDYRRRVQNFGSTDEIVEIVSARVTTLRAVIDRLELGKPYAEWETEHAKKYAAMQKRRERQADA